MLWDYIRMEITKAKLKANKKYAKSEKGKVSQAKSQSRLDKATIDGIRKETKKQFNDYKKLNGFKSADECLKALLGLG